MEDSTEGLALPLFSGRLSEEWAAHEQRLRSWLAVRGIPLHAHEAAETLSLSLEAQAALAFEREAGGAERFAFETAVEWCRNKWGGETRQRWATAAAVNALNARSFREHGRRREGVKDLVNDLDLLFLQAGVADDEARKRAFIGCFFEFPHCFSRLARTEAYGAAITEALVWEGDMVRKEREVLTARVKLSSAAAHAAPHSRPMTEGDMSSSDLLRETPGPDTSDAGADAAADADAVVYEGSRAKSTEPTQASVVSTTPTATATAHPTLLHPTRSHESLSVSMYSHSHAHAHPDVHVHVRDVDGNAASHEVPRAQTSLGHYAASDSGHVEVIRPLFFAAGPHPHPHPHQPPPRPNSFFAAVTARNASHHLTVPDGRASFSTTRSVTPPFVTEATSFRSSFPSTIGDGQTDMSRILALYEAFPYPGVGSARGVSPAQTTTRSEPTRETADKVQVQQLHHHHQQQQQQRAVLRRVGGGTDEPQWRSATQLYYGRPEHQHHQLVTADSHGRVERKRKPYKLANLFRRSFHGRGKSLGSAAELARLDEEGGGPGMGRPAKARGKFVREGLELPP